MQIPREWDSQPCKCGHESLRHHGEDRSDDGGCFGVGSLHKCSCRRTCSDVETVDRIEAGS